MRPPSTATTSRSGRLSAAFSRGKAATFWKSAAAPASTPPHSLRVHPELRGGPATSMTLTSRASPHGAHIRASQTCVRPSASISAILIGVGPATPTAMRCLRQCCASTSCTSRPGACQRICLQERADSCESMAACLCTVHSGAMACIHPQATRHSMPACGRKIPNGVCATCRT